jgi:transcriptional regulator with XRE-family HTH domain
VSEKVLCLADLRKARGLTQTEVAERMGTSQARISGIEGMGPMNLQWRTLSRYIDALGGTMSLVFHFPDNETVFKL